MSKYQHTPFNGTTTDRVLTPGSDEWARTVSASKVPAILGISPWESAYSLWARATGRLEATPGNKATERGDYLEPAILRWFKDKMGADYRVTPGKSYIHPDVPEWTAAPDGIIYEGRRRTPFGLVEVKTAYNGDDWGPEGTAEIPPYYLAQILWQMYVTGARTVYVPTFINMEFRLYLVRWEDIAADVEGTLEAIHDYMVCVLDDVAPSWDGSEATYEAVRRMHPDIEPDTVATVPDDFAANLWAAHAAAKLADTTMRRLKSEALDAAGSAKSIQTADGTKVARRQANKTGVSFVVTPPKAPALKSAA